jgi:hypothetical protein
MSSADDIVRLGEAVQSLHPSGGALPWSTGRNRQKPGCGRFVDRIGTSKPLKMRPSKGEFPKRANRELNPPNRDLNRPDREGKGKHLQTFGGTNM